MIVGTSSDRVGTDPPHAIARLVGELAPLLECTSERAGWIHLVEIARDLFSADVVVVLEFTGTNRSTIRSGAGYDGLVVGLDVPSPPGSHAEFSRDTPGVVLSDDLPNEPRFTPSRFLVDDGIRSSMSLRLELPDGAIAALGIHARARGFYGQSHVDALLALGDVFASTMGRLRRLEELERGATIDSLTGLMNRAAILERLESGFDPDSVVNVLLIDIDGFKAVNDTHGHRAGDAVLQMIAQRIDQSLGTTDVVGRLGGDEFLAISNDSSDRDGRRLAERLIGRVEEVIAVESHSVQVSASIGIARRRMSDPDAIAALEHADRLMYQAKAAGRGKVRVDPTDSPAVEQTTRASRTDDPVITAESVGDAIDGLRILVQPIVDPFTGTLHGVEALARGPEGHCLEMPDRLFAAARTFSRLGDLEIETKRQAFDLDLRPDISLYVNVEPILLCSASWMSELTKVWEQGRGHGSVIVELTERAVSKSPGRLLRAIDACRELGFGIALDDVGSRSESLASLGWIDPDVVKLDMSLVVESTTAHTAHVSGGVEAHRSDVTRPEFRVVAEGVETADDARVADALGADLLQGYLFGRPTTIDELRLAEASGAMALAPRPRRVGDDRVATFSELKAMTYHMESVLSRPDVVLVAAVQSFEMLSERMRHQFENLAKRCAFVGLVGAGMNDANVSLASGVRLADLADDDSLRSAWQIIALSPSGPMALLAEEIAGQNELAPGRQQYRYRFITDVDEAETAARTLLRYF